MSQFNSTLWNASLFGGAAPGSGPVIEAGSGLLYPALRKAAITLGPGRMPSPAQFQDAIEELNRLLGSLNCDRLFIYSRTAWTFPLTGVASYTIGQDPTGALAADFDAPRPQFIEAANVIASDGNTRRPLVLATDQVWSKIAPDRASDVLYNDRAYPLSTLELSSPPPAGEQLELFCWTQVPVFRDLADVVLLPPGYEDAIVLNLAVRLVSHFPLAPNLPRQVDPNLYQQARESLMRLESLNAPQPLADTGGLGCGCGGGYNIYSDTWK